MLQTIQQELKNVKLDGNRFLVTERNNDLLNRIGLNLDDKEYHTNLDFFINLNEKFQYILKNYGNMMIKKPSGNLFVSLKSLRDDIETSGFEEICDITPPYMNQHMYSVLLCNMKLIYYLFYNYKNKNNYLKQFKIKNEP